MSGIVRIGNAFFNLESIEMFSLEYRGDAVLLIRTKSKEWYTIRGSEAGRGFRKLRQAFHEEDRS